jgi:hypothetical protein
MENKLFLWTGNLSLLGILDMNEHISVKNIAVYGLDDWSQLQVGAGNVLL